MNTKNQIRPVPPSPEVMKQLYRDYLDVLKSEKMSFRDYLALIGYLTAETPIEGQDSGNALRVERNARLVEVPRLPVTGNLPIIVLLVDFSDNVGHRPVSEYEEMLFSNETLATKSLRDFYKEVSGGRVDVTGTVHGWLRMPKTYAYYVDNKSGLEGVYPRNAQKMAEDAVLAAKEAGVNFPAALDKLGRINPASHFRTSVSML
jgi:immune inhibitor A